MKTFALLLLGLLSFLWWYFAWKYLNIGNINSITITVLLSWMFVFGVLFGKIPLLWKTDTTEKSSKYYESGELNHTNKHITEIEPLKNENDFSDLREKNLTSTTNDFANFENIQDGTILNVANSIKKQDLKVIEGIGPKIEKLLNNWGILSYADLEQSSINQIKLILERAWSRYIMHNPSTWKKQASLAENWAFSELKVYQDRLKKWVEI